MTADGYSLDDKRSKQEGNGDLQDIAARYHARNAETDTDRTQKSFVVPRSEIEDEGFDLSLSRYKEDVFEEIEYEAPTAILDKLLKAEVGDLNGTDFAGVKSGIVKELLELREMIG
jgi:type I restriction enzyme M protein